MTTNMGQSITFPQFMCSWIKPILVKKFPKEKCHSRSVFSLEECNGLKLDSSNWKMAINGWNMTGSKSNDDWPCGLIIKQLHTSLIGSHPLEDRYIIVRCSRFWIVKMLMDLWKGNKNTDSQCVMLHGARCTVLLRLLNQQQQQHLRRSEIIVSVATMCLRRHCMPKAFYLLLLSLFFRHWIVIVCLFLVSLNIRPYHRNWACR